MSRWQRWVRLLDTREPAHSLAAMRMFAGATLLWTLGNAWSSGAARALWIAPEHGGIGPFDPGLFRFLGGATWPHVRAVLALTLVAGAFLLAGAFTRVAAVIAWLGFAALTRLNPWSGGAGDQVLSNALFILLFAQSGAAWSFDARGRSASLVPAWPRYLAIGQLITIYASTGGNKFSAAWLPGGRLDAVWYTLQNPLFQRWEMLWVAPWAVITRALTLITWLFEVSAPLLLLAFYFRATSERPGRVRRWFNRWDFRACYLALGFCLHVGIEVTMEVGAFFGAMLTLYTACLHPSEWLKLRGALRRPPR
jgi:hypothetical protein